ncbi:MAG: right-handed parallel beta-helix repeat-containing protein [Planctomycetes bacterium]|nr:right-handed parallel beta-helix repeat-containing protein [Planctomycetota bacterium]
MIPSFWRNLLFWQSSRDRGNGASARLLNRTSTINNQNARRRTFRPFLEVLEDRTVLSTLQVTSVGDSGTGTLRQAIQSAVNGDTIAFDPTVFATPQTISLTSQLSVTKDLTILGPGAKNLTVSGKSGVRVFLISAVNATLDGLTISNAVLGSLQDGGGIRYSGSGTLSVQNCAITNNSANSAGGIYNAGGGTIQVVSSTLSGNQAGGGGVAGGIWNQGGTLIVTNSTLSGNVSNTNEAGGIWNNDGGTTTLLNATVFGNQSRLVGGGIWNQFGTVNVKNSIIANNTSTTTTSDDVDGVFTSQGNNLVGDTDGSSGFGGSDLTGTGAAHLDPKLSPLGDYGGPTQTNPPLPGSPTIDAGNNAGAPATDQRGIARPFGPTVDIGAVEADRHYFTVTTTADSGAGSLRQAILDANNTPNLGAGPDIIQFDIPGSGVHTITPGSALPNITEAVLIDGYSQPGSSPNTLAVGDNAVLEIRLDGASAGSSAIGLHLQGPGGSTVRGLSLTGFGSIAIAVDSASNVIEGNFLGLLADGTTTAGNGGDGVLISNVAGNLVGGTTPDARNLISGNAGSGVEVRFSGATGNVIAGNYIGTDKNGSTALGNGPGILVDGVSINIGASNNTIGGSAAGAGNLISGNNGFGVHLYGFGTSDNKVQGNRIGTDATGTAKVGNTRGGVEIDNSASGNFLGTDGDGVNDFSKGNLISGNSGEGVQIGFNGTASGNVIAGNFIGTNAAGTAALGNQFDGITIGNATNNRIGTNADGVSDDAERNVISGNGQDGVSLNFSGTTGNVIAGNFIGTDVNGTLAVGNGQRGVVLDNGATNTVIGGTTAAARNVISGNGFLGSDSAIDIAGNGTVGNVVEGNYIGTNAVGTATLPNAVHGVAIFGGAGTNTVGGTVAGAGNVISGNLDDGVFLAGAAGSLVAGNLIGTNAAGTAALGNDGGIRINSAGNTVGGTTAAVRNIISGNNNFGIALEFGGATGNIIEGNLLGTDLAGTGTLGNVNQGVIVTATAADNTIGGTASGAGNTIAFNGKGVVLTATAGSGNAILGNSIFANTSLGIDLGDDGITPNGTPGPGPNNFQSYPVLFTANGTTITGTLHAAATTTYRLEFFSSPVSGPHRQGKTFLGATNVTTDGTGDASFVFAAGAIPAGEVVTATATNLTTGDTSEFSAGPPVLITASEGSGQSTTVNTLFASPLQALVTDAYNDATPGVPVTFTAPATGPSATFAGSLVVQANTNTFGVAASPPLTANTTPGSYSVSATAAEATPASFGLQNIAGPAASFLVSGFPSPTQAGVTQSFTISAVDQFGNVDTTYAGTVVVTSSDPLADLPAPLDFSESGGVVLTSATLKTAGPQSLTASDGVLTGTETAIVVGAAPFTRIALSPLPSSPYAQGGLFPLTVAALDPFGNIDPNYRGTVAFTSDDPAALLPPPTTFGPADAGIRTFNVALETPGMHSITAQDSGGRASATQGPISVINVPPTFVRHPDVFLNLTGLLVTNVSFVDPGTETELITVDFGDDTGVQTLLASGATRTFTLTHDYTADASFVVEVTVTDAFGGHDEMTFLAHVFLPDIMTIAVGIIPPGGTTVTVATTTVQATLKVSPPTPPGTAPEDLSYLIVADVPSDSLAALPDQPDQPAFFAESSYDIRAINIDAGDQVTVIFHYQDGNIPGANPVFEFFNERTKQFEPVHGSTIVSNSLVINTQARTNTLILDGTSFPTARGLTGTVFTIVLPSTAPTEVTTQLTPQVALAATRGSTTVSDSGSGLSTTVTLRTSSQPTLSLTPTTGGQAGDRLINLSGSGGSEAPPEEELPALWKMLLEIWRMMQRAASEQSENRNPKTENTPKPTIPMTENKSSPFSDLGDSDFGFSPIDPLDFGLPIFDFGLEDGGRGDEGFLFNRESTIQNPQSNSESTIPAWAWAALLPALVGPGTPKGMRQRKRQALSDPWTK